MKRMEMVGLQQSASLNRGPFYGAIPRGPSEGPNKKGNEDGGGSF